MPRWLKGHGPNCSTILDATPSISISHVVRARSVVELATLPELATDLAPSWWPTPHLEVVIGGVTTFTAITVR